MASFQLTPEAKARIDEIWLYSAHQWGLEQADAYHDELAATFQNLANQSLEPVHPATRLFSSAPSDLSYYRHGKHYIFFCREADGIQILSVIHTASQHLLQSFFDNQARRGDPQ